MIDVERQKSNTSPTDILRLRNGKLQICESSDGSEEELAQLQARCNEFWRHHEQELEWMHMEEHQPGFAAIGRGGLGVGVNHRV